MQRAVVRPSILRFFTASSNGQQLRNRRIEGLTPGSTFEDLPLNGRNFLDLAKLEPGVTNAVQSTDRVFVPMLDR